MKNAIKNLAVIAAVIAISATAALAQDAPATAPASFNLFSGFCTIAGKVFAAPVNIVAFATRNETAIAAGNSIENAWNNFGADWQKDVAKAKG